MQPRKKRKGFWWWTWLLAIFVIGGTGGGWFIGEKMWEKAPKEYRSTAKLRVDILPPYKGTGANVARSGIRNRSETAAMRDLESVDFLIALGKNLELKKRWKVKESSMVNTLREAISIDLNDQKELFITVEREEPKEAKEIVNVMAPLAVDRLAFLNEQSRKTGLNSIEERLGDVIQGVEDARSEYAAILKANGVDVDPKPGMDLNVYNELGTNVSAAQVEWQSALEDLAEARKDFLPETRHWERKVLPSTVLVEGELPTRISGPDIAPFRTQGAIVGVSLGITLGLLAMLLCWKLFS